MPKTFCMSDEGAQLSAELNKALVLFRRRLDERQTHTGSEQVGESNNYVFRTPGSQMYQIPLQRPRRPGCAKSSVARCADAWQSALESVAHPGTRTGCSSALCTLHFALCTLHPGTRTGCSSAQGQVSAQHRLQLSTGISKPWMTHQHKQKVLAKVNCSRAAMKRIQNSKSVKRKRHANTTSAP